MDLRSAQSTPAYQIERRMEFGHDPCIEPSNVNDPLIPGSRLYRTRNQRAYVDKATAEGRGSFLVDGPYIYQTS